MAIRREQTTVSESREAMPVNAQWYGPMQLLTEQEALVLHLRYQQPGGVATSQAVAGQLGLSEHTVRRIERDALRKLRQQAVESVGYRVNDWDEV